MFRSTMSSNFSRPHDFVESLEVENKIVPEPVLIKAPAPVSKAVPAPVRKVRATNTFSGLPTKQEDKSVPEISFSGLPSKTLPSKTLPESFSGLPIQKIEQVVSPPSFSGLPSNKIKETHTATFSGLPSK